MIRTQEQKTEVIANVSKEMRIKVPKLVEKKNGAKGCTVKMDLGRANENIKNSQALVDLAYPTEAEREEPKVKGKRGYRAWSELFALYRKVIHLLFRMSDWPTEALIEFQAAADAFGVCFFTYIDKSIWIVMFR
jgi:hypothetical protein